MDKTTHPDLLNALGVEKMEANEKGVMLSNAQAEMLNKALAEASKEKTRAEDLEKEVKELKSTIEAMKEEAKAVANADGAETGKSMIATCTRRRSYPTRSAFTTAI